ncbi:MAG: hypothetical protein WD800_07135 [Dehalococcoidia bacterium]
MLYGVMCRLGRPAAEYPTLSGAIQAAGVANWPVAEGTWLIESDHTAEAIRDSIHLAIEEADLALVFPLNVGPARWTSLRDHRYGRQFLQSALQREQATPSR